MKNSRYLRLGALLLLILGLTGGAWTSNQFMYKPDLGARGALEKTKYDSGLDLVDARLSKTIWVGDPNYGPTLQTAITAISSRNVILRVPPGTHNITADLTIPANIALKAERGATFAIDAGKTLTINGPLDAGPYPIFTWSGTGKVVLGQAQRIYPQWWGAKGDGINNDFSSLQACLNAAAAGSEVFFLTGSYLSSGAKIIFPTTNNLTLVGSGQGKTKLIFSYADYYGIQFVSSVDGFTIKDMTIQGPDSGTNVPAALMVFEYDYNDITIQHVEFKIAKKSAILFDTPQATAHRLLIERCWFHHINVSPYNGTGGFGTIYTPSGSDMVIRNNIFENLNNPGDNLQHAIYGFSGDRVKILDNYFSGDHAGASMGSNGYTMHDCEFSGNVCSGVRQFSFWYTIRGMVLRNIFNTCSIAITNASQLKFSDNILKNNYTTGGALAQLNVVTNGSDIAVQNNFFQADNQRTIYLGQNSQNVTIQGNYLESANGWDGGQINTTGTGIRIINNYWKTASHGFRLDGMGGGDIIGNQFNVASGYGIRSYLADPSSLVIRNNVRVAGTALSYGCTNLPLYGNATLSSGTVGVTFPGALADANYQVIITGGANETFYVSNKTATGFTIRSSNASSTASVDYEVNRQ